MSIFSDATTVIAILFVVVIIIALLYIVFRIFGTAARRNPNHPKNRENDNRRDGGSDRR